LGGGGGGARGWFEVERDEFTVGEELIGGEDVDGILKTELEVRFRISP